MFRGLDVIHCLQATAVFGSVRSLCFNFAGQRMNVSIRAMLFRKIMVQNVQFFDDMSTAELLSRMTNDIWGMLTPIRTMLSATMSNLIMLIGALVYCFSISWKLSMLAFTTVAPMVFLTSEYAKWSRAINLKIWCAFSCMFSWKPLQSVCTIKMLEMLKVL